MLGQGDESVMNVIMKVMWTKSYVYDIMIYNEGKKWLVMVNGNQQRLVIVIDN